MARRARLQPFSISRGFDALKTFLIGLFMIIIIFNVISDSYAISWSSAVKTNTSSWYIYRQSDNISFDFSSSVEGTISPVDYQGNVLPSYYSYYADANINDIRLKGRTSALAGSYKSENDIKIRSEIVSSEIDVVTTKDKGSKLFTVSYNTEQWPAVIMTNESMIYSGQQINDRDFEGNNGDYVGSSFQYSHELSKDQRSIMWQLLLNASVLATNDSLISVKLLPTKYLGYVIRASSNGIADLSYMNRDSNYDIKHRNYPPQSEGEERFYGKYDLSQRIEMRSSFEDIESDDDWLPCCCNGWDDMTDYDKRGFGSSTGSIFDYSSIFDCKCYKAPLNNS